MSLFYMRNWPEKQYEIYVFKKMTHETVIRQVSMISWNIDRGPTISSADQYFSKHLCIARACLGG